MKLDVRSILENRNARTFIAPVPHGGGGIALADNRPAIALQRKSFASAPGFVSGESPLQLQRDKTGLPENLKSGIEAISGYSMDDVNVHYNSSAPATLQAHAFARGTEIHIAPGQEQHLAHEAWHVVQQKQGRVKQTFQMKDKVPVNDDITLEKEADVMGRRALQFQKRPNVPMVLRPGQTSRANPVQKRNVHQAGLLLNYAQGANANLYNIPPAVVLPQGHLYTLALPMAANLAAVLDAYINETRAVAQALANFTFLDINAEPPNVPSVANWHAQQGNFKGLLANWIAPPAAGFAAMTRPQAVIARNDLVRANRVNILDDPNVLYIDPFIQELTIPQAGAPANWVIETNFSNNALSYITRITAGSVNLTGRITPSPAAFNAVAAAIPGAGANYAYSPEHDTGIAHTVGHQIGGLAAGASNAMNHPGFDAFTKLGAEGARFEPVRELGLDLKVNSLFFTIGADDNVRAVTFRQLYQNWENWFHRDYGITAADVQGEVAAHGAVYMGGAVLNRDYDLDRQGRASMQAGHYGNIIHDLLQDIDECQQRKQIFAQRTRQGRNREQVIGDFNRGQNRQISFIEGQLAPYKRMFPGIYQGIVHPPPPVVIAPVAAPVVAAPVVAVAAPPAAPANGSWGRVMIAGTVIGIFLLGAGFLYGRDGLLFGRQDL